MDDRVIDEWQSGFHFHISVDPKTGFLKFEGADPLGEDAKDLIERINQAGDQPYPVIIKLIGYVKPFPIKQENE